MLKFETWKIVLIVGLCLLGPFYAFPNLLSEAQREKLSTTMPGWFPHKAMSLGLDLQGGSHLQLQVDMNTILSDRLDNLALSARSTLREAKISTQAVVKKEGRVEVILDEEQDRNAAVSQLRKQLGTGITIESDNKTLSITHTDQEILNFKKQAIAQSIEIVRRRVDEVGTKEPIIQAQGEDRIIVQLPGMKDPERVKELIGKTARLTFHMVDMSVSPAACQSGQAPLTVRCLKQNGEDEPMLAIRRRALLTGDMLMDAQSSFGQYGESVVRFRFDSLGARKFADITRNNVGKPFAIVLDNVIITAPNINGVIPDGSGEITGNFTVASANDLAVLMRAGALPAPLKVVEERTVGPSLGADSISSGKTASIVSVILVTASMLLMYGWRFGSFVNIALVFNVCLMIAILSLMGATLTLPGIVGIVLTIGMAVDANVLIFERMREEVRNGRNVLPAVDHGFQGAMSSIIDANVTTLIAAIVLFAVGTGPVRGFSVTLAIGLLTSMFTSIYLTRLMIVVWVDKTKPKTLPL